MKVKSKLSLSQIEDRFIQKPKLVKMAKRDTSKAIEFARLRNVAITYTEGLTIFREFQGKKTAIGSIEQSTRRYKKGDRISLREK